MTYCAPTDILEKISEDELIGITDDDDASAVDIGKVNRAIADAGAEIDSYCGTRYKVPFVTVPPMIRKTAVAIAIYNLFQGKHGAPEDRRTDYEDAVNFLKRVAANDVSLGVQPEPDAPAGETTAAVKTYTRGKTFSSETMDKY